MRYHEITPDHPAMRQSLFNTATLFIPAGQVDAFVETLERHCGQITQTRALPQFDGYSVDVLTGCPDSAALLLADWLERSRTISDTVQSGKTVVDTLSDLIDGEGAQ
jgi:hypothetical protein